MRGQLLLVPSAAVADDRLMPVDVYILLVIGDFCDAEGWTRVGQRTLAETARQSRDTIISSLRRLEDAGWLRSRQTPGYAKEYLRVLDNLVPGKKGVGIVDIPPVEIPDTPIPDGFPDIAAVERATRAFPNLDVRDSAAAFRAHHVAAGSVRRDWGAAWVRWCQTAHKDRSVSNGHPSSRPGPSAGASGRDAGSEIARLAAGAARHASRSS